MTAAGIDRARIRAVLFDLDDTLVDARGAWRVAFAGVLAGAYDRYPALRALGRGEDVHDALFQRYVRQAHRDGGGEWDPELLRRGFRLLLAEHARRDDAFADRLYEAYRGTRPHDIKPFPDAVPALEALGKRFPLALVSNGPGPEQRSRVRPLGLEGYFAVIAISGELGVRKPDRAIFEHVLGRLGVPASAAVHIGDDLHADVAGARAAGLAAVWVNRGGVAHGGDRARDDDDDAAAAADAEVTTLAEVVELLGAR